MGRIEMNKFYEGDRKSHTYTAATCNIVGRDVACIITNSGMLFDEYILL